MSNDSDTTAQRALAVGASVNDGPGRLRDSAGGALVLLAEDRPDAASTLQQALEQQGYRVQVVSSRRAALDVLAVERPEALVMHCTLLENGETDVVCQARAVAPAMPIIIRAKQAELAALRLARARREINAVHDDAQDIRQLLDLISCAVSTAQGVERLRTEQEVRCLTLAKLCHNLRSPLHVIQGYTEVLRDDPGAHPFADILGRVSRATETAIRLLHEYLARVRFEVPDPTVRRELLDVDQLLAELQTQATRQIGSRSLRLAIHTQFTGAYIQTDREKLKGILSELLSNAIKFTPSGTVTLGVRGGNTHTQFTVADQGPGISAVELKALFSPFRQRSDETFASLPGQGIGLAIARRLSTLIGAVLIAERGEKGGAIFSLSVPEPMIVQTASAAGCALH